MTTTTSGSDENTSTEPVATEYAAFFQKLVDGQEARKTSIESRGITVITTSGTLATLVFALVALLTKADDFTLPRSAHGPIGVALILFVVAGVLALVTNLPLRYKNLNAENSNALLKFVEEPAQTARVRIAATNLNIYKRAQGVNEVKAYILIAAIFMEIAAVASVAIAVAEILNAS